MVMEEESEVEEVLDEGDGEDLGEEEICPEVGGLVVVTWDENVSK